MKLLKPELIGDPDCPIVHRWTLIPWGQAGKKHEAKEHRFKLMVHHFLPNADERHFHDHPRSFWTLVLRGGYDDMKPCEHEGCDGDGCMLPDDWPCPVCNGTGTVINEKMRAGMLRHRPATHCHKTRVLPGGCWTIVTMGPQTRKWGFWIDGVWMYWKEHQEKYGYGMRCN